jgi:hypothetical protein
VYALVTHWSWDRCSFLLFFLLSFSISIFWTSGHMLPNSQLSSKLPAQLQTVRNLITRAAAELKLETLGL